MTYTNVFAPASQREALDETQIPNNAGGFSFQVDDWAQLNRFLTLGTVGGSFYVGEKELTKENARVVQRCLDADWRRTIDKIEEVSVGGKAAKQDQAIFALAMAAGHSNKEARTYALSKLASIARTGTMLFMFMEFVKQFRGTGRALREAVASWYTAKGPDKLGYQLVKYRQRNGWTHADVLRLSHPKPSSEIQSALFKWVTADTGDSYPNVDVVIAFAKAQKATSEKEIVSILKDQPNLPWEALPTQFLNSTEVWDTLLGDLPLGALLRQLPRLTSIGLVNSRRGDIAKKLVDHESLRKARLHPLSILNASYAYEAGRSRGSLTWDPDQVLLDALQKAFYAAFEFVEPANKRTYIGLDVSGSMGFSTISGTAITPRVGSAALSLVTARTEPDYRIRAFCDRMVDLDVKSSDGLNDVLRKVDKLRFGSTDCAMPMLDALDKGWLVDTFIVYTDSETWAGHIHPMTALKKYRQETGIPARLVVVGMVANNFSIADPADAGSLDVVGFSTDTPSLISEFSAGRL